MRSPLGLALLLASVMLAACVEPAPADGAPADDGAERTSRGAPDEEDVDNRTSVLLGQLEGGLTDAGRYPFQVTVPPGGAAEVTWVLTALPALTLGDGVAGPACAWERWYFATGRMEGTCAALPEGTHELAVVLNEPAASFRAEVRGLVAAA